MSDNTSLDVMYVLDGVVLNGRFSQCTADEFDAAKDAIAELIRAAERVCSHPDRCEYDLKVALAAVKGARHDR